MPKLTRGAVRLIGLVLAFTAVGTWSSLRNRHRQHEAALRFVDLEKLHTANYAIDHWRYGRSFNAPALERLAYCTATGSCGPGEKTVILLASSHFGNAQSGSTGGEDIWAMSSIRAFESLNYTLLYTYGIMDTLMFYQHLSDLVPVIIWEGSLLKDCISRNETWYLETEDEFATGDWQTGKKGCIRKEGFEEGIPIWKSFAFAFFPGVESPLGRQWTLAPENYSRWHLEGGNYYLGYSVEERCMEIPFREHRENQAIILAKQAHYFSRDQYPWKGMLLQVSESLPAIEDKPFRFVTTAGDGNSPLPELGVTSLGPLRPYDWFTALGSSKVMIGIGDPAISPSPYEALCLGVPFINVLHSVDGRDPEDRHKWSSQHEGLVEYDPPYVYHTKRYDREEFEANVRAAVANPIPRTIPERMTTAAVRERHKVFVETDWLANGRKQFEETWPDGSGPFVL